METVLSVSGLVFVLLLGLLVRLVPPSTLQPNRGEPRATPRTSSVMATFMLVPRGEVRPNGSGKTTLLNLIPRFVDVTEGGVRLDDQDVRDLVPDDLWASIGLVPNAKATDAALRAGPPTDRLPREQAARRIGQGRRGRDATCQGRRPGGLDGAGHGPLARRRDRLQRTGSPSRSSSPGTRPTLPGPIRAGKTTLTNGVHRATEEVILEAFTAAYVDHFVRTRPRPWCSRRWRSCAWAVRPS